MIGQGRREQDSDIGQGWSVQAFVLCYHARPSRTSGGSALARDRVPPSLGTCARVQQGLANELDPLSAATGQWHTSG
jgi:hypothetical protein